MVCAGELVCGDRDAGDSDTGAGAGQGNLNLAEVPGNWCPFGLRDMGLVSLWAEGHGLVSLVSLWAERHGTGVTGVPLGWAGGTGEVLLFSPSFRERLDMERSKCC